MDRTCKRTLLVDFHHFPQIPLFEDVDEELVVGWMVHRPQRGVRAGERLIQRDRLAEQAFLLLEGELMVHLDSSPAYDLGSVSPGDCVGEVSTLCGIPATANVSAAADSVVCEVPRDELMAWSRQSHQFALNLISLMGHRLRTSNRLLSDEQHSQEQF